MIRHSETIFFLLEYIGIYSEIEMTMEERKARNNDTKNFTQSETLEII